MNHVRKLLNINKTLANGSWSVCSSKWNWELQSNKNVCATRKMEPLYPAHFISKLSDSDTEAAETEVWLDFALKCGYIGEFDHQPLRDNYDHICRMLTRMMASPESWQATLPKGK